VSYAHYFKIQIPAKIFFTRIFISCEALFPQFPNQPGREAVSKTARVNEIVFRLSHVEGCAVEGDNCFNLRVYGARKILTPCQSQVPD
jgi:hypothetical protein